MARPRVAAIVTEYRPRSHADVIVTKLLEGYSLAGSQTEPRLEVASLYLDQVPENDIGHEMAAKHGVPIFGTIGEALAAGDAGVNVDGVLLIGEHGRYPINELGQKLYPRRRFFDAAVAAMVAGGRMAPVFTDKHLSWSFDHARWMVDTAERLDIPLLAGSSLPVTWRIPSLDWPLDADVSEALVVAHGDLEAYGFHALETLQCMVERRTGGEHGAHSIQCLEGDAVWQAAADGRWSHDLFQAALEAADGPSVDELPEASRSPAAFLIQYRDGLRATVLMLEGAIDRFGFAGSRGGRVEACQFFLQRGEPFGHFSFLVRQIESLVRQGRAPYPVERTLLTTGMLDAAMRSRDREHEAVETPELQIAYNTPEHVVDTGINAPLPGE